MMSQRLLRAEEKDRLRKIAKTFFKRKTSYYALKSLIGFVYENMRLKIKKNELNEIIKQMEQDFWKHFNISKNECRISTYGLTGAGIQFKNSNFKL